MSLAQQPLQLGNLGLVLVSLAVAAECSFGIARDLPPSFSAITDIFELSVEAPSGLLHNSLLRLPLLNSLSTRRDSLQCVYGVWHISGLGISPGALKVPTTSIYLLLRAAEKGDSAACEFFETSEERTQKEGNLRGFRERFVIFTSKDVLEKKINRKTEIKDRWFRNAGKEISVPRVACKFINLSSYLILVSSDYYTGHGK